MIKKFHYLIFAILFSANSFAQNSTPKQLVKEEASLKALSFLNLIPEGREKDYGFNNRSDFARIKIEEPYETFYVLNKDNELSFIPGNEWRVPVSVDGKYVSLLTVQFNKGQAEVVDLGGNVLSGKIQEYEKMFPDKSGQRVLIRNTFIKKDYITNDFIALATKKNDTDKILINKSSAEPVYEINESQPRKISMADFYSATMDIINNATDLK